MKKAHIPFWNIWVINNALREELEGLATVANFATVQKEGNRTTTRHKIESGYKGYYAKDHLI